MAIEFKIPTLGENIESADVGQILVKEGDILTPGKGVLELETDKAVFEVECPHGGRVSKIHVNVGDSVQVGSTVLTIEGEPASSSTPAPSVPPAKPATPEKSSTSNGTSSPPRAADGAIAVKSTPEPASPLKPVETIAAPTERPHDDRFPLPAAPSTRRMARELGVDLHDVPASGPGGRITQEDVRAYVKSRMQSPTVVASAASPVAPPMPSFEEFGEIQRVRVSKLGVTSAANLSFSWQTIPHVTQHDLVDVTEMEADRRKFIGSASYKGPKVTMTVVAVKAVVAALKAFPHFNASFDTRAGEVIHKHYYNIGIAVDTENGLLVPVIKNADRKSILEIAEEITALSEKARARKLEMSDMKGGSFTISNLGGIGGTGFTPIINWPEVAILGMSRTVEQPRLLDGKLENRLMLPLSLSYDHRVINGADAARFVRKLVELLSDGFGLLAAT